LIQTNNKTFENQ